MASKIKSKDPLGDALKKLGTHNIDNLDKLRIAKGFAYSNDAFVGFEGRDSGNNYFCLRVDYDEEKLGHVNLTVKDSERYEYIGESSSWYTQVISNINSDAYCGVPKDNQGRWKTDGREKYPEYIEGMKKYIKRVA